jgi:TRAP-type C4-dicarboxylate transport system substrate-binding protein
MMMKMKKMAAMLPAALAALVILGGCLPKTDKAAGGPAQAAQTKAPRVFKMGNSGTVNQPSAIASQLFCDKLNERLNGEIKFEFYPAEQLGNEITMLENLQVDLQQVIFCALDTLANYDADLNILSMAFAFASHDHMYRFMDSDVGKNIWKNLEDQGIHVVSYQFRKNPRIFFGKKPFYTPADMKGVKYRIPNIPIFERNARAMGAVPTVVAWSEYPFALMQGVVDCGECSKEAYRSAGLWESAKYVSEVDYAYPLEQIAFSSQSWNSLTKEQQKIVEDTAAEVAEVFNTTINNTWKEDKQWLIQNGVTFVDFNKQAFLDAAAPLGKELDNEKGFFKTPGLYALAQKYR